MPLKYLICSSIVNVIIDIKDIENDGKYNYLLKTNYLNCEKEASKFEHSEIYISYSSFKNLGEEGMVIKVKLDAECSESYSVNEQQSNKFNQWISNVSLICSATNLEKDK